MHLLVQREILPPACVQEHIMDTDVIAELSVKVTFQAYHLDPQKPGPLFQIFNNEVRLVITLGSIESAQRHTTLEWKVSLNSNNAIVCVHIGMEVEDWPPTDYVKILSACQYYERLGHITVSSIDFQRVFNYTYSHIPHLQETSMQKPSDSRDQNKGF